MSAWIVVEGWDEFQHVDVKRGTGPPPWIKNYVRLMQDDDYMDLSPVRALMLHRLWLAYAQSRASLRADTRLLNRRLGLRVRQSDLDALVQAGFITISASKPQAPSLQDASASRARIEEEEEVEEPPTHLSTDSKRGRVGGDQHKDFALPAVDERPELEPDNGVSRLSPHEELLLKKGNVPF